MPTVIDGSGVPGFYDYGGLDVDKDDIVLEIFGAIEELQDV